MKRKINKLLGPANRLLVIMLLSIFFAKNAHSQIINEGFEEAQWQAGLGASSTSGQIIITNTSAASTLTYINAPGVTTTALNSNPNSGTWWYSKAASNTVAATYTKLDKVHSRINSVKLSSSGYIVTPLTSSAIVSVTFWASLGTPMLVGIATDPNVTQPTYSSTNPIPGGFANFSTLFPANAAMTSYSVSYTGITGPVRIGFFNNGGSSTYIDDIIITQPTGTPPSVTTDNIVPGITDAKASGTITPGTLPLLASGIIWSTSPLTGSSTDTTKSKTFDRPSATASYTDKIGPLAASTTYYEEAYVIGLDNTVYFGAAKNFTTNPLGAPTVSVSLNSIYSNKAAVTGNVVDSGGLIISEKGFIWTKNGTAPTLTNNIGKQYEGSGTAPFTDFIKGLAPNTNYCVSSYAINSKGSKVSPDTCFTTGAPVPTLTAVPGVLDFGSEFYKDNAIILSYTLTGSMLDGSAITITAPAGFIIATTPAGLNSVPGPGNTITLTTANTSGYSGGSLSPTPIYVEMLTGAYGTFTGSNIIHSGAGVLAANADMVTLTGTVVQSPVDISNSGSDFWMGFGYEEKMSEKSGDADECRLSVYVTTGSQPATVHVVLNSGGYTQTQTIPANSYYAFTGFPTGDPANNTDAGGFPDARLYSTGISNKAIHVYSDNNVPVSVFMHSYTHGNSAAGAMIFPSTTWNSSYTVQAFGGTSNNSNPNSFFFVIADQDNTVVTFTPTQPILDPSATSLFNENASDPILYPANGTYQVTLNKGQVFNAMGGFNPNGNGLDLSGTKVSTTCDKKITVFGGNGRCLVGGLTCTDNSGSDHLIQQMFPSVAWGTTYLTAPTLGQTLNYFRIYVQDPTTVVKINGATVITPLVKGIYYEYQTAQPALFTSDKPINVSQFMLTPTCSPGAVDGGPEMIILSPVEQAISNVTFYSPTSGKVIIDGSGGGYTSYMNVIIPTSKAATFKLDGAAPVAGSFKVHPQNPGYSYATLQVASQSLHKLSADTGFVAIAYGVGDGESYGFNAGTAVKNLSSVQFTQNPYGIDSSGSAVRTCVNNPVKLRIALPYNPALVSKITWNPQLDPRITPNDSMPGAMNGAVAKYDSTINVNGRTFYVYTSPVAYTFLQNGTYRFPVQVYGTFASDCPGEDIENMLIIVGHDQANLAFTSSCGNPTVTFTADTIAMAGTYITKTIFNFGDNDSTINGALDTSYTYPLNQVYTARLTTYNSVGCVSVDSTLVDFSGGLKANFTKSTGAVCSGSSITFTDNTVASGISGTPNKWIWDFGDKTNKDSTTGTVVSHPYLAAGKYAVTLTVRTTAGCIDMFTDTVTIEATPVAAFTAAEACLGNATVFTDASSVPGGLGTVDSSFYDFGDGTVHDSLTASTLTHVYAKAGTYKVKLYVRSDGGCTSLTDSASVTVDSLPTAGFTISPNCVTDVVTFTDTSHANGGTIIKEDWSFGDGSPDTTVTTAGLSFQHPYPNGNGKSFTITLTITTKTGCTATALPQTFGIGASPAAQFSVTPGTFCAPGASVTFTNTSSISDGTTNLMGYVWDFGDHSPDSIIAPPPAPGTPPTPVTHTFTGAANTYTVTLIAQSNKGCTSVPFTSPVTINPQPLAVISPNPAATCLNDSLQLSGSGTGAAQYNWNFGDGAAPGAGNAVQNPKYKWAAFGKYAVSLVTTSSLGCVSDSAIDSVTVNDLPVANFTVQNLPACAKSSISFTDASSAPVGAAITQWHWDFGDGTAASTQQNPTHTYVAAGTYKIKYWVSDGCTSLTDSATSVTIHPLPAANFTVAPICLPGAAQFTDQSTVADGTGISQWTWDFGDGTGASPAQNPSYQYAAGAVYPVKLTVISGYGCQNDTTIKDTANSIPVAKDSIVNDTSLCSNKPVVLLDQSSVSTGSITKIDITWGDNSADSIVNNPAAGGNYPHHYAPLAPKDQDAVYNVTLTAYSGNGCPPNVTAPFPITVHASPNAQFTLDTTAFCQEKEAFNLGGGSDLNGLPGTGSYSGPGVIGDTAFWAHQAGPGGPYSIVYTFTTIHGCSDTASQAITVYPTPSVNYGGVQSVLDGDSLTLNPVGTPDSSLAYLWSPSLYLNSDTLIAPLCKPVDDITYSITVTSPGRCQSTTTLLVQVLKDFVVPNTFTPNNDGINDTWVIQYLPKYPIQWVQIFDRYGQLLFESHGYNQPWDGTYNGKPLPSGTYYYIIEVNGLRAPKTGYVTILR